MPEQPKPITAWAIKAPDGKIYLHKITKKEHKLHGWEKEYGRTCVRVHITEVPHD